MGADTDKIIRKAELVYSQPVAMAVGQILRSRTNRERLDASLKTGEILTRYIAGLSLASYKCRSEKSDAAGLVLENLQGPLSWGHFLDIIQAVCKKNIDHPFQKHLVPYFSGKKGKPSVNQHLINLLEIRNDLGHTLSTLTEAQALNYLKGPESVTTELALVLRTMEAILSSPLFIVEETNYLKKQFHTRLLWLMGQSPDPVPFELILKNGIEEVQKPYVAVNGFLLNLWPFLIWDMSVENLNRYVLLLLDQIRPEHLVLKPIEAFKKEINGNAAQSMREMLQALRTDPETTQTTKGLTIDRIWVLEKKQIVAAHEKWEGLMPWEDFDKDTLDWYARLLDPASVNSPKQIVQDRLFEKRDRFELTDIQQARLLFGDDKSVAKVLRRELIDLRSVSGSSARWDERVNKRVNVLKALKLAVDFFCRHMDMDGDTTVSELSQTEGPADYLAMREALINIFIHQDYTDERSSAQVELKPQKAMFSNPGYSMVSYERLSEGGKSQSRNPLIARALRLIGFAELAGSGLRALNHAWRQVNRRPPRFESDHANNSFALVLDWKPVEDFYDTFWKDRIGVKLTPEQARILNLACEPEGVTLQEAAAGTGLDLGETEKDMVYLSVQCLIEQKNDRFYVVKHLGEAIQ